MEDLNKKSLCWLGPPWITYFTNWPVYSKFFSNANDLTECRRNVLVNECSVENNELVKNIVNFSNMLKLLKEQLRGWNISVGKLENYLWMMIPYVRTKYKKRKYFTLSQFRSNFINHKLTHLNRHERFRDILVYIRWPHLYMKLIKGEDWMRVNICMKKIIQSSFQRTHILLNY